MLTEITPRLLKHISSQISNGRPLWGLLTANEYLSPDSPIRRALVARALPLTARNKQYAALQTTLIAVLAGKRLGEIADIHRITAVTETAAEPPTAKRFVPTERKLRQRDSRQAVRSRRATRCSLRHRQAWQISMGDAAHS